MIKDPEVQLFLRIEPYHGGEYVLSDGSSDIFHVDFFNGWKEGTLQTVIDSCEPLDAGDDEYNPPCHCDQFLTENPNPAGEVASIYAKYQTVNTIGIIVKIYNSAGQLVKEDQMTQRSPLEYEYHWKTEGVGSGIYFYKVMSLGLGDDQQEISMGRIAVVK